MKKVSSYYAGQKVGEKFFWETITSPDASAVYKIEKARITCAEYCSNMKLEKTKKGVKLTKEKREFYQGMYDYLTKPTYNGYFD